ncbi:MAG: 2-C-methyl-D-erythritol 2,4-cyclodiphosphate synthase [Solirubrobacterales bacterium]|nr:2-C-methyl-D-erythritol 2,4-cyclodiphosphate synthase [Solirubrobacterales bacterium]
MTPPRFGIGYDVHPLAPGRPMVVGGVTIDSEFGPVGHSDADVLCHAITDALLGAAALGDIGELFPDTDEQHAGADSVELLRKAVEHVHQAGFKPWNVDATVNLETPKLIGHRDEMRTTLAGALGIPVDRVSVKATRGEGLGFVGRGEGMSAMAVVSLTEVEAGA